MLCVSWNTKLSCKTVFPIFSAAVGSTVTTLYQQCSKYPLETSYERKVVLFKI